MSRKDEKDITFEAFFYCRDCDDYYDIICYHGVPVSCPECHGFNVELETEED